MRLLIQNKAHFNQVKLVINFVLLFLLPASFTAFAKRFEPKTLVYIGVSGQVTDGKNLPLTGVSVNVKGSSAGTSTTSDGKFAITVSNGNDTLVFSYIGYISQEVPLEGRSELTVQLVASANTLNDVVVVGYGTQKRQSVTAAISTVPLREIKDMPVSNVATALQGKIPGVVVQQSSGSPGSTPAIKVRGFGSISAGTNPLIVVDG